MEEQQQPPPPPAQSPYISSSSGGGFPPAAPEHPRPPPEEEEEDEDDDEEDDDPEERRPWEEDDFGDSEVLDLTGGAGGFAHPPFTVCFPGAGAGAQEPAAPPRSAAVAPPEPKNPVREEERSKPAWEEVEEEQPSSPEEEEEVPPDRRPTAPAITPLAPLAPPAPAPAPRRGPSGSADETFFALPAASASLMHSSAESPDLQELPYKPASPGREDFSSMLHESSASLPSLSPLSAPPVQDHTVSGSALAQPPSAEALQEPLSKLYLESMSDLPIVAQAENHSALNLEAQKQMPQALIVDDAENEQHIVPPKPRMTLFESLKDALSEKGVIEETGTDHVAFKESGVSAEYVDFKPFSPVLESRLIDQEANSLDDIFKMDENSMNEADAKLPSIESYDAIDKASVLPELPVDSTHYVAAQILEMSVDAPDAAAALPPLHDHISENQTDEKKLAEMEAHWGTDLIVPSIGATDPFAVEFKQYESGHVATDSMSAVAATNVSDSLTPDLVQEACESEMHDASGAQLTYTSKIDLVQTSDSVPEPLISEGQISPSPECTQSVQSPVLPDIVMEAPVNIGVPGLETQPKISPLEDIAPLVREQQIKLGSEKPPSYEEAVNDLLTQTEKHSSDSTAFEGFASVESTTLEEIGTPYISIACDLVKETKISNDDLPPGFSEFSKDVVGDFVSQSVPKPPQKDEESSPDSELMDFDRQWGYEVREVSKVFAVSEQEKATDRHSSTVLVENKSLSDLSSGKVYMESFQPETDLSQNHADFLLGNPTVSVSTEEGNPLQMEELGKLISSEKILGHWEPKMEDDSLCMGEPSPFPVTEDFLTKLAHSEAEKMDNEHYMEKQENESMRNVTKVEFLGEVTLGKVLVTAEEHLQSINYSPDLHEVSAAHLLPKESAPSAREEFVCSSKQEALEIEDPKTALSTQKEKGERPTPSVAAALLLSARLGKTSVVDLLYWRDIKKTGVVFGASLFLLLSLTVFSIVSVSAYIALALLSVTISYRIYRGVFQAIQKSDEGHPFKAYLDSDVAVSQELVQKYSNVALGHVNCTVKELRRLFLVEDLVDSLKFAVLMWVLTYVGALFNGLTLLILALISLFSVPIIYERHQTQIDHYLGMVNRNVKDGLAKIQAKIPGLKPKAE